MLSLKKPSGDIIRTDYSMSFKPFGDFMQNTLTVLLVASAIVVTSYSPNTQKEKIVGPPPALGQRDATPSPTIRIVPPPPSSPGNGVGVSPPPPVRSPGNGVRVSPPPPVRSPERGSYDPTPEPTPQWPMINGTLKAFGAVIGALAALMLAIRRRKR